MYWSPGALIAEVPLARGHGDVHRAGARRCGDREAEWRLVTLMRGARVGAEVDRGGAVKLVPVMVTELVPPRRPVVRADRGDRWRTAS